MAGPKLPGELTWPKLIGTGLAAMIAAWLAGHLGWGGTLTGAALGSVVATAATAFFTQTVERGATMLVRTEHGTVIQATAADVVTEDAAEIEEPSADRPWWRRLHWKAIAAASALTMVVAMFSITVYEQAVGRTWGANEPGTTLGKTFNQQPIYAPTPTPTHSPTPTPTPMSTPTPTPTPVPTPTPDLTPTPTPVPTPTPSPTDPSVTPTPTPTDGVVQ